MIAREIHETRAVAKALPEWIWCRFELGFRPRTMATGRRRKRPIEVPPQPNVV
jgi:hypothetical protein